MAVEDAVTVEPVVSLRSRASGVLSRHTMYWPPYQRELKAHYRLRPPLTAGWRLFMRAGPLILAATLLSASAVRRRAHGAERAFAGTSRRAPRCYKIRYKNPTLRQKFGNVFNIVWWDRRFPLTPASRLSGAFRVNRRHISVLSKGRRSCDSQEIPKSLVHPFP
jgi:hypothetical protein